MLLPRHQRRVVSAARRLTACDQRGEADDQVLAELRRRRAEARRAGHDPTVIDDWTMAGCVAGWRQP